MCRILLLNKAALIYSKTLCFLQLWKTHLQVISFFRGLTQKVDTSSSARSSSLMSLSAWKSRWVTTNWLEMWSSTLWLCTETIKNYQELTHSNILTLPNATIYTSSTMMRVSMHLTSIWAPGALMNQSVSSQHLPLSSIKTSRNRAANKARMQLWIRSMFRQKKSARSLRLKINDFYSFSVTRFSLKMLLTPWQWKIVNK